MPTRFDGFYIARYQGLDADAAAGYGVMFLKDGKVYGGDNLSCFLGEFEDNGNAVVARVKVFLITSPAHAMKDLDDKPWDLPDVRGDVPQGVLPPDVVVELFGQRHDTHQGYAYDSYARGTQPRERITHPLQQRPRSVSRSPSLRSRHRLARYHFRRRS